MSYVRAALEDALRRNLAHVLAPVVDDRLIEQATQAAVEACSAVLEGSRNPKEPRTLLVATDQGVTLQLPPPPPKILWRDRKKYDHLRCLKPEQFITSTDWAIYRDAGYLTGTFLLNCDQSLYSALSSRASYNRVLLSDLLESCGVVTRRQLDHPTLDQDMRKVEILKYAHAILCAANAKPNDSEIDCKDTGKV